MTTRPDGTRGEAADAFALRPTYPYYVGRRAEQPNDALEVLDKYTGEVATRVAVPDRDAIERAISAAERAARHLRAMPSYARRAALEHCATRFAQRAAELARVLCIEAGKPIRDARGEVDRLVDTFRIAAVEATRAHEGSVLDLEVSARARGTRGMTRRVPVGPVSLVTPFNFPLNLVAHKIAPAIAAGCPFVLKPSERTPVSALILADVLAETDLPDGAFSVLPAALGDVAPFIEDPRFALLSFTGSSAVGWSLRARAGRKKVVLELGGNAACIVDRDQRDALAYVVERLAFGAFYQSGQSCVSVQRVLAHDEVYDALRDAFVAKARALPAGDPRDEATFVGPLIDEASAARLEVQVAQAVARGARVLAGGTRRGTVMDATVLEGVPTDAPLYAEEAFGPVVLLERYDDFDDALRRVNSSRYGLQAGLFTRDLARTMRAWDELEVGGVIVGDVPSFRVDNMPYGGVKDSGAGREGVRYAIEDMTELRLLVVRDRP